MNKGPTKIGVSMMRTARLSSALALGALLGTTTSGWAIDPAQLGASPTPARAAVVAEPAGSRSSGGGIFGCSADGNKQTTAAVVGGLFGAFLGNRIAGRGNRTIGTLFGGAIGAAGGSAIGCKMQKDDRAKAEQAMQDALARGENQRWSNSQTGASGSVDVLPAQSGQGLAGLKFAPGVEPWSGYQQVGESFVSTAAVNVRARPGLDGRVVGQLPKGVRVWVPAAAEGAPWYLVSDNGVAWGYVSNSMLRRASDGASECRMVRQTVNLPDSGSQSESYQACKDVSGQWTLTRV